MKNVPKKLFDIPFVRVVRHGLLMLIPILTVGSAALILRSFPVAWYQSFISTFAGGFFYELFSFAYNSTFGMLSLYMVVCLSYCSAGMKKGGTHELGAVSAGVAAFLISVGFLTASFKLSSFSAVGMFTAIICGTAGPALYLIFDRHIRHAKIFTDGSEPIFNHAISVITPLSAVCVVFGMTNFLIDKLFGVSNFWQLFSDGVNYLFSAVGLNFFGGLLYILLSSIMWFFGIHGSDVLESVTSHLFEPAMAVNIAAVSAGGVPTEMYTKEFFDVFVLIGGCGSALSLLAALFIFSKRRSSRSLAKLASIPMLFNINELMVFGLPIVYNPTMLIPFVCAPVASFLIASTAMYTGLVPLTSVSVEWTTPIILGGYRATGSVAGALLQIVNFFVGILIYMPFVKRLDRIKDAESNANIDLLVSLQKENETQNKNVLLTEQDGIVGMIAKQLVNDLQQAINDKTLFMVYQPQNNSKGECVGAEALLRFNHPSFGLIYPPLVIKLAEEGGFLCNLEKYVFLRVKSDMERHRIPLRISINATSPSLQSSDFIDFLVETFPNACAGGSRICIEITEQTELVTNSEMTATLSHLRDCGFLLAIDDFSMGFTSLKYLRESHFDEIKLDGSLVRNIGNSPNTVEIISSIVYLSESLGFSVLAEYVETEEQRRDLEKIGCHEYQGYLFSKPIAPKELYEYCHHICNRSCNEKGNGNSNGNGKKNGKGEENTTVSKA